VITLHRIHATNFRSLGDAVFEPLVDGGMTVGRVCALPTKS